MSNNQTVRTRFAPSPTGFLHVGGLRTALYAYLWAKKNNGDFLLRIEDTDQQRKVAGAEANLKKMLKFFGLKWDGKVVVQSKRLSIYKQHAEKLVAEKKAYYCFCTKERLEELRKTQQAQGLPPGYDGFCDGLSEAEIKNKIEQGQTPVIRFRIPKTGQTEFNDIVRGRVVFDNKLLDDPIILKSDGFPTYHLANVIDDQEMKISHVIRGEEWLPSAPKHLLIYQALDFAIPEFAHLPLLLNPDRSKLSKRQGDVAVEDYLKNGYLPETLLNFILLLGWNPKTEKEIFTFKEMLHAFDLKNINKSGAVFDLKKLDWLNGVYIRHKSIKDLAKLCRPYFSRAGIRANLKILEKVVATEKDRIKKLSEIVDSTAFFFAEPKYQSELLIWKKSKPRDIKKNLICLREKIETLPKSAFNQKKLEEEIMALLNETGIGTGDMLWPMRVALSGRQASPGPFEIAAVLGKKKTIKRLNFAISLLETTK